MLTGSIASSLQGEPRSTHDIALVVAMKPAAIAQLVNAFPSPRYYLNPEAARGAITNGGTFNLIDVEGGDKIDFWVLTDGPFDQSRFSRRYEEELGDLRLRVSRPEDTILMKLRWSQLCGGSEKQFVDALRVYEVQYGDLDLAYAAEWARRLGIESLWQRLEREAHPLGDKP